VADVYALAIKFVSLMEDAGPAHQAAILMLQNLIASVLANAETKLLILRVEIEDKR
jgi:hypothetical protein